MRPIKFRGRDFDSGKYVYGFYVTGAGDKPFILVTNAQGQYLRPVAPDSVAQLVGYDKNGNEVYEGDRLINKDGSECEALYQPTLYVPKDALSVPIAFGQRLITLTLKEAD